MFCQILWFCSLYGREAVLVPDFIKFKRGGGEAVNTINWNNACIHLFVYDTQNSKNFGNLLVSFKRFCELIDTE